MRHHSVCPQLDDFAVPRVTSISDDLLAAANAEIVRAICRWSDDHEEVIRVGGHLMIDDGRDEVDPWLP